MFLFDLNLYSSYYCSKSKNNRTCCYRKTINNNLARLVNNYFLSFHYDIVTTWLRPQV